MTTMTVAITDFITATHDASFEEFLHSSILNTYYFERNSFWRSSEEHLKNNNSNCKTIIMMENKKNTKLLIVSTANPDDDPEKHQHTNKKWPKIGAMKKWRAFRQFVNMKGARVSPGNEKHTNRFQRRTTIAVAATKTDHLLLSDTSNSTDLWSLERVQELHARTTKLLADHRNQSYVPPKVKACHERTAELDNRVDVQNTVAAALEKAQPKMFRSCHLPSNLFQEENLLVNENVVAVRNSVIGRDAMISTPFGNKMVTYADYTASGRLLGIVEDFMKNTVGPMYANTHTEASATGLQTMHFREEARAIIAESVHADKDEYAVLFVGTGMTGAIHKLIDVMGLRIPSVLEAAYGLEKHIPASSRPVVFVGPSEHHSNEVSWRETIADVVVIEEEFPSGRMDLEILEKQLERFQDRPLKIVSFSAGSNVTGIANPVADAARIAKRAGALCFVDYAGAGPYVPMTMTPAKNIELDAIFCSPHKFPGGPGATGLLVAKRSLFSNKVPTQPGGGTVSFVSPWAHDYIDQIESREDGGTPAILQAIRCGLAFHVREMVGIERIRDIYNYECFKAIDLWSAHQNLYLLGANRTAYHEKDRLPIISFNVLFPTRNIINTHTPSSIGMHELISDSGMGRRMLHPHFVCALLNDVYGIQSRSGCSCTGPYAHRLLELDQDESDRMSDLIVEKNLESVKLGWVRINFAFTLSEEESEFIRQALIQVAEHGWMLLPLYAMKADTGQYLHRSFAPDTDIHWLSDLRLDVDRNDERKGADAARAFTEQSKTSEGRAECLYRAASLYSDAASLSDEFKDEILGPGGDFVDCDPGLYAKGTNGDADAVDWMDRFFVFPSDALHLLNQRAETGSAKGDSKALNKPEWPSIITTRA